jgi:hypothetical protein
MKLKYQHEENFSSLNAFGATNTVPTKAKRIAKTSPYSGGYKVKWKVFSQIFTSNN